MFYVQRIFRGCLLSILLSIIIMPIKSMERVRDTEQLKKELFAACSNNDIKNVIKILELVGDDAKNVVLGYASGLGNREVVKALLDHGANIRGKDRDGKTALHFAAEKGHIEIAELLILNGADVNALTSNRRTPLYTAAEKGHTEITKLLITKGAYVNRQYYADKIALHCASENGHTEIAELLISSGADVNADEISSGWTALHYAAEKGHTEIAELLISSGADVNTKDEDGLTALRIATDEGHREIVTLLIAKRADINEGDNDNNTALHFAAKKGHKEIAELLIKNGAHVNAKTEDSERFKYEDGGKTALYFAAAKGHKEIVKLLILNDADIKAKTTRGITALHRVSREGHTEIAELLIKNGAHVNAMTNSGRTALQNAAEKGHTEIVELLILNGAEVNAKNFYGRTAFHSAVWMGHTEIAELLIKNGAHVNAKDIDGETALHRAAVNGPKEIVGLLISNGAHVNAENGNGKTALHSAAKKGHTEIAEILILNGAEVGLENEEGKMLFADASYDLKNTMYRALIFRRLLMLLQTNNKLLLSFDHTSWLASGHPYAELNKLVSERKIAVSKENQSKKEQAEKTSNSLLPLLDLQLPSLQDNSARFCEKYRQEFDAGLALDGEGLQVMVTASMIEELEKEGYIIHKLFDIITGSSFAGILALGLTASKDGYERSVETKDIIKLFSGDFRDIFSVKKKTKIKPCYALKPLQKALANLFKETVLSNTLSRVMVPCDANQPFDLDSLDARKRLSCDFYLRDIACITAIDRSQEFFSAMPLGNLSNITSSSEYKNKSAECLIRNVEETLNKEEMQKFRLLYCVAHQDEGNMRLNKKLEKMNELTAQEIKKSSEINDQIAILKKEFDSLSLKKQEERHKSIDRLERERSQLATPRYCYIKPSQSEASSFDNINLLDTYKEQGKKAAEDFIKKNEQFLRLLKENSDRKQHSSFFAS